MANRKHGSADLAVPPLVGVERLMRLGLHKLKVAGLVVALLAVAVMNDLAASQWSLQQLLHNHPMLMSNAAGPDVHSDIAALVHVTSASPAGMLLADQECLGALERAELPLRTRHALEGSPALLASARLPVKPGIGGAASAEPSTAEGAKALMGMLIQVHRAAAVSARPAISGLTTPGAEPLPLVVGEAPTASLAGSGSSHVGILPVINLAKRT